MIRRYCRLLRSLRSLLRAALLISLLAACRSGPGQQPLTLATLSQPAEEAGGKLNSEPTGSPSPGASPLPAEDPEPVATKPASATQPATATLAGAAGTPGQELELEPSPQVQTLPTQTIPASPSPPAPTSSAIQPLDLRQLTSGGCCVQPFWSADSQQVLFLDKPGEEAPAGFYAVGLQGGEPSLVTQRIGLYSPAGELLAYPQGDLTLVERISDGQRWTIANGGREVSFSPDGARLAWTGGSSGPPYDTVQRKVWTSRVDGGSAQPALTVYGGGFVGWFPDGRLLISGRRDPKEVSQSLWAFNLESGDLLELARAERLRSASLSPDGTWLAYLAVFAQDAQQDGLWLVNTQTLERRRLDLFGAYAWRDGENLLLIPMESKAGSHRLIQVRAASGEVIPLSSPQTTAFKIAGGDWAVSPDGRYVVFVSAQDHNLWLIGLPDV